MSKTMAAVPIPGTNTVYMIGLPQTASADPLTVEQEFILALNDALSTTQAENERLRGALDLLYYEVLAKMTLQAMVDQGADFDLDDYILEQSSGLWSGVKAARAALEEGE